MTSLARRPALAAVKPALRDVRRPVLARCGASCDCDTCHGERKPEGPPGPAPPDALHRLLRAVVQQRKGTGAATLARVEETLDSPRFAGEPLLLACFEDRARMGVGARDTATHRPVAKVQQALIERRFDLGPTGADGVYGPKTAAAVRAFKKAEHLGSEQYGDVGPGTMHKLNALFPKQGPAPPPAPPGPTPPTPPAPPAPPAAKACGPDIDESLSRVLVQIQNDFRDPATSVWDKRAACTNLHVPPMAIMAWDVLDLYLPHTSWINTTPGCSTPRPGGSVEDPSGCSNSVWAGGHCHLAGTANYAMFGIVQKLCSDFRAQDSWWWQPVADMYSESATRGLINTWKTPSFDDPKPPIEWALTTYRGGPRARPASGNRDECARCGSAATSRVFDYSWSPIHGTHSH